MLLQHAGGELHNVLFLKCITNISGILTRRLNGILTFYLSEAFTVAGQEQVLSAEFWFSTMVSDTLRPLTASAVWPLLTAPSYFVFFTTLSVQMNLSRTCATLANPHFLVTTNPQRWV